MKTIVETAVDAGSFDTLVTAVRTAGLDKTLNSKGPFTVFAPNDVAFGKLPKGTLEKLLKNKKKLASILKYHVVPGKIKSSEVVKLDRIKTALGKYVSIKSTGSVKINNANVIKPDIETSNGVIHIIDKVLIPN